MAAKHWLVILHGILLVAAQTTGVASQGRSISVQPSHQQNSQAAASPSISASNSPQSADSGKRPSLAVSRVSVQPTRTKAAPVEVPSDAGPAAASMMTPKNPQATPTYYKVGNPVTLAWNYSNVYIQPESVDIQAYCAINQHYYPIRLNTSYEQLTKVEWDTAAYQMEAAVPLLTAQYTLVLRNTEAAETQATAPLGEMGVLRPYVFGMYLTQGYRDLEQSTQRQCSLCFRGSATRGQTRRGLLLMGSVAMSVGCHLIL
ncbi:hypothetical protein BCR37DRAFT_75798 [Protomyces lactucae-debilis]|uniref:DUF7137 domain-containing protein n=1 Tax=Protomyces lactucae-debilis TaxID=2754530 RepID=A0A1Y2F7D7_PROLT|nr:uncharacterized protein BCR37DRAFT_75798 [Protomyces lactucae-debilis]ORY79840.1 hypothetical protein BCR37DRAFT_75798 [Protomyces lactucae-debilis]